MHKAIVNSLTDEEFIGIISNSYSINEAANKMGFAHEPGKGSKEKIRLRMKNLNISFKEKSCIKNIKKESAYIGGKSIGFVGEKAFEFLCAKKMIEFFKEPSDNKPYDYIIKSKFSDKYFKIQVKTSEFVEFDGVIEFYISKTRSKNIDGNLTYDHVKYNPDDIDYFFLYCIETDQGFLVSPKVIGNKASFSIRIKDPLKNQKRFCNFAKDYLFNDIIERI